MPAWILGAFLLVTTCLISARVPAQSSLEYQNRGDRYEGVRPRPVSGAEIELISALIDYQDPAPALPDQLKVRFFLEHDSDIHLTVRELDVKHYYWLDRARSPRPWTRGFGNEFAWPTDPVLRKLDPRLPLSELGVVARLGRPDASADERVAPALLYHAQRPATVRGYVFVFKTSADARIAYTVYRQGRPQPLVTEGPLRARGSRPFSVHWSALGAEGGVYRVVLDGYWLDTNLKLDQTVRFVHQPTIP
ncbi:MAG TPA: hypothetical protein VK548_00195 [Candidatus Acidoferrum sp.]|nr:hypothetical protein [Candidatus Acidoferrum sp.]